MNRVLILLFATISLNAGFFDSLNKTITDSAKEYINTPNNNQNRLDSTTIVAGLKEALAKGVKYASKTLGKRDGFWKNPAVKIPLPPDIQKFADYLKKAGMEQYVIDFEKSLNRAAEKAAPQTLSIFTEAISQIKIEDAKKILNGPETAATDYLKSKTYQKIYDLVYPIVKENVDKSGSVKYYNMLKKSYEKYAKPYTQNETISMLSSLIGKDQKSKSELSNFTQKDIYDYTTSKTLEGIFKMIAQEERKIRKNPLERTSDLLKKVFAAATN